MAYIVPVHQPSSIRHAVKSSFLGPEEDNLVVAKANRIEIYRLSESGLTLAHSKALYGKVTLLESFRLPRTITDHLLIGTDRYMYFTLSWDPQRNELHTEKSFVDVADKSARDSQSGDRCNVDPTGQLMTLELLEGVLTVIPLAPALKKKQQPLEGPPSLGDPINTRISEMFVKSSAFLKGDAPSMKKPRIALLYEDTSKNIKLKFHRLLYTPPSSSDGGDITVQEAGSFPGELDAGATHIIPVPEPSYGVIILGETQITYFSDREMDHLVIPLEEATVFVAWEQIDNQRFIIADDYGRLYLFMLVLSQNNEVTDWKLEQIGITSRASALVYLDAGMVFVGSHQGDSQLIRILQGSIEVLQTFPNVAPILDFTIMNMGNRGVEGSGNEFSSGQARIITGSGAYNDGSLRSIRSGVGMENLGSIGEMPQVIDLFSLRSIESESRLDTLIASFIAESRVFSFSENGDVEELADFCGLKLSETTLCARNLPGGRVLQVTPSQARLTEANGSVLLSDFAAPEDQKFSAAVANDQYAILSAGGMVLIVLDLQHQDLFVKSRKTFGSESQVACFAIPEWSSSVCVAGFWQNSAMSILSLDTLDSVHSVVVAEDNLSVPRSIVLAQLLADQQPTLLVATTDGNVVTYFMDKETNVLSEKKTTVLGTQHADLRLLPRDDGLSGVMAICEHPSLIYGSEGRLVYSAITAETATCVCPVSVTGYANTIAIAAAGQLGIATIEKERTTHVQSLPIKETVRRVAYAPALKAFGLGTIRRTLKDGAEIVRSCFKLADEVTLKELGKFMLKEEEIVESVMHCCLDDGSGELDDRFVIGTAYLNDEGPDMVGGGRIIVLEVTQDRQLTVAAEIVTKGACRCLGTIDGRIVAALMKTVVVYEYKYTSPKVPTLTKVAAYRTSTAPIDLAISGHSIAVADIMKSISIVEYRPGQAGAQHRLVETARHYQTMWAMAVAQVGDDLYLEADAYGNLSVLTRNRDGLTEDECRRLVPVSEMSLGELVNRIRPVDVPVAPHFGVEPKAFLATVEGSLHLFCLIHPTRQNLLMSLQSNIAQHVASPGDVPFMKYRAFRNQVKEADEPFRFVDGDLVDRFLDMSEDLQGEVCLGLEAGVDEVRVFVEALRRLR